MVIIMTRLDIIQFLLDGFEHRYYLEIGVSKGDNFVKVKADYKVGVHPIDPSEKILFAINENCEYFPMTSDNYFEHFTGIKNREQNKFSLIFFDGLHEYEAAYRNICNALNCLSDEGIIVVRNCKPTNEVIGLPPDKYKSVSNEIKAQNKRLWTGDVWKSIVRLRSSRDDLLIFTLDCDWGCAIITRGTPESKLQFSEEEINAMQFNDLNDHCNDFLNLKSSNYLYTYILSRQKKKRIHLYVEKSAYWEKHCAKNYNLQGHLGTVELDKGIILPTKLIIDEKYRHFGLSGGVCDCDGNFAAGILRDILGLSINRTCTSSYKVNAEDLEFIDETVVYGGVIYSHFGHFIMESLCRLWWWVENKDKGYKIVFNSQDDKHYEFYELLNMSGMNDNDIMILDKPKQFKKVIVPEQSAYFISGYHEKFLNIYNCIRDSVKPAEYEKIYLTRTKLPLKDAINEEYFEQYYQSKGYKVVAPEQLSIREQVSIMAGASEVVCVSGTLPHLALFAKDGIKLTVLVRSYSSMYTSQLWLNQARDIESTYIDVSMNLLPTSHVRGTFLLFPTEYWKKYLADIGDCPNNNDEADIDDYALEYIKLWAKNFAVGGRLKNISKTTIVDVVYAINKFLLGKEIDKGKLKKRHYLHKIEEKLREQTEENSKLIQLNQELINSKSILQEKLDSIVRQSDHTGNAQDIQ